MFDSEFPRPAIVQCTAVPPIKAFSTFKDILVGVEKAVKLLESQDGVKIIRNKKDLEITSEIGVILGLQLPPSDATLRDLEVLKSMGVHLTTLSYRSDESPYGSGPWGRGGLTPLGRRFVDDLGAAEMWLDLSHANHRTARNAIEIAFPITTILATHTGCFSIHPNPRNLPDDVLRDIAISDGIIGLYTPTFGLDPEDNSTSPFAKHAKHLLHILGPHPIALGTDGVYRHMPEEERLEQYTLLTKMLDPDGQMGTRFPIEPEFFNLVRKDRAIKSVLFNEGFTLTDIESFMFSNALRFLEKNL